MFKTHTNYGEVELPDLTTLPIEVVDLVLRSKDKYRIWVLMETVADTKTLAVIDAMPADALKRVVDAWECHNGLKVEELLSIRQMSLKYRNALEADLIDKGLRLRHCPSEDFNWRDLWIVAKHLPITSNFQAAMYPESAGWTKTNMLLAEMVDTLHWLQWAKTKAGSKGRNRPKPWPRPGVTQPSREGSKPKAAPISVIKERFANRHRRVSDRASKIASLFTGR